MAAAWWARSDTSASAGASSSFGQGGRPRNRRRRPRLQDHQQQLEYTGDGHTLAYDAGADLMDMEFVGST